MTSWKSFVDAEPDLAGRAAARFTAAQHHVMATLRADGSPRVSGTEVHLHGDELYLGSMPRARKATDLQRDPRVAIHANPADPTMSGGDAKCSGLAVEIPEGAREVVLTALGAPEGPSHLFAIDLHEVVLTSLHPDGDRLVIERWTPAEGVVRIERR